MVLEQIIKPDSVLCNAHARSKKHSLEILSQLLSQNNPDIANEEIFARLIERERLGCTSLREGVAFPRCRIGAVGNSSGALVKLTEPVDFDAPDGLPVDLIVGLIVPKKISASHHADIEMLSTMFVDQSLRARLRSTTSSGELFDALLAAQSTVPAKIQLSQSL